MVTGRPSDRVTIERAANLVTRDVLGETIVVPVRSGAADLDALFVLNATGAYLWRQLDNPCSRTDLVGALLHKFEVVPEAAERDVDDFLDSLAEAGLLSSHRTNPP